MSVELVVGQNCYFDVAEANQMISDNFLPSEVEYIEWNKLTNEQKTVIIYRNTQFIENYNMFWRGCKIYNIQSMQFPRNIDGTTVECPDIVKLGILMNGVNSLVKVTDTNNTEYGSLIDAGIEKFADGSGASVTFKSDANRTSKYSTLPGYENIYKSVFRTYFSKYSLIV
ncbi:MAG: hypothetical protein II625_02900 [Bacilli bacterium]|nr:hypothetical protein [Bacilli bacterium]